MRSPLARLPRPWRTAADWAVTLGVAVAFVLVFEAEIAKPYRIPSSSMEPTLHCARPALGCHARFSDRVLAAYGPLRQSSRMPSSPLVIERLREHLLKLIDEGIRIILE